MDKITFENLPSTNTPLNANTLNTLQNNIEKSVVAVSRTQPTTNENVWIKSGKNMYDLANNFTNEYLSSGEAYFSLTDALSSYIEIKPNTSYAISTNTTVSFLCAQEFDENKNLISNHSSSDTNQNIFTSQNNAKYIRFWVNLDLSTIMTEQVIINLQVMLEQNTTVTEYEPYVQKEILLKNTNGEFEKFVNIDEILKLETRQLTVSQEYFSTIDVNFVQKMGRVVIIDFRGLVKKDIPGNTSDVILTPHISTLGSSETGMAFKAERYGNNASTTWFYMDEHSIKVNPTEEGKWLHIHHVYMTNY